MGVWSTLLKYGGKAMKGVGTATSTTGKSMGKACLLYTSHVGNKLPSFLVLV